MSSNDNMVCLGLGFATALGVVTAIWNWSSWAPLSWLCWDHRVERAQIAIRQWEETEGTKLLFIIHDKKIFRRNVIQQETAATIEQLVEQLSTQGKRDTPIDILLHTEDGEFEAVTRVIHALSEHPGRVRVYVPRKAHGGSAAIALCGQELYMGGMASLTAYDPQILRKPSHISAMAASSSGDATSKGNAECQEKENKPAQEGAPDQDPVSDNKPLDDSFYRAKRCMNGIRRNEKMIAQAAKRDPKVQERLFNGLSRIGPCGSPVYRDDLRSWARADSATGVADDGAKNTTTTPGSSSSTINDGPDQTPGKDVDSFVKDGCPPEIQTIFRRLMAEE